MPSNADYYRPASSLCIEPIVVATASEPLEHEPSGVPVGPLDHGTIVEMEDDGASDTGPNGISKDQSCKEFKKKNYGTESIGYKESTRTPTKAKASGKSKKDKRAKAKSREQSQKSARSNEKAASIFLEDSIEAAWKEASLACVRSARTDLSYLFLTSVEQREDNEQALDKEREQPGSMDTPVPLPISSTIWLPMSSIVVS